MTHQKVSKPTPRKGGRSARSRTPIRKVFMSFAAPDLKVAEELKNLIEATERFSVIPFDKSQRWHRNQLNVALAHRLIGEADVFLAIYTQESLAEKYLNGLRYEYGFALFTAGSSRSSPCRLVRVVVEDTNSEDRNLPEELLSFHTVDFRDPQAHESCLNNLVDAMSGEDEKPSDSERQRYILRETLDPNPRREMFRRILAGEFERAFSSHIGPLTDRVQRLTELQRAQDNLMTPEIISVEEANAFDSIWVVSHSLHNDLYEEKIRSSIVKNLKKGIKYTYFLPATKLLLRRRDRFEARFSKFNWSENGGSFTFIFLKEGVFMPFDELVVYDGESATNRWGYLQMNYDRPTTSSSSAGLVMKVPDRTLSTIIEFLSKEYRAKDLDAGEEGDCSEAVAGGND
ncbi:MAG: hypothetical protein K0U98_08810 [Deltaproteobacteria bacterium]|nr:hypothetical protein [Deltaproteobacteria bacterium]